VLDGNDFVNVEHLDAVFDFLDFDSFDCFHCLVSY
jgi:hypothetical protein